MGFRWYLTAAKRNPKEDFSCSTCTASDAVIRNCSNHKDLPDEALAVHVDEYTYSRYKEHERAGVRLVHPLGEYRLYECPLTYITQETRDIMSAVYLVEDSKQLLFPGGLSNQPCWLVEALGVYKAVTSKLSLQSPEGSDG